MSEIKDKQLKKTELTRTCSIILYIATKFVKMERLEKFGMGVTSIIATLGVNELPLNELIQALTQVIIAIGTLIAIFRKKNV